MVKFKGLCPSLKKSVEFDVTEIIELPTKRGIKYQVKGDYEGRTCSTFTSKAKALALREEMGGRTMSAEEDMTGQAHQEDGVRPLRGDIQPLAEGQEPSAELPLKETVSQPITGTDVGVEPIESLELPDLPESSMETQFDEAPAMEGDIEIASMMPEGDGQSIGNNTPMNPDVPLHAEETSEEVGQEEPSAEQLPLKETVPEDFSPADSQVSPLDDLSVSMADPVSRMEVEFDQAPEIIAEFSLAMPQPFGDGRSIGNITPMNPDVPFASESVEFNADPLDETSLEVPPAVVFIEKIPPTVWENMTVETQMDYAETGDENLLVCPQCGITKGELRGIGGYCAVTDPEGEVYDSMVDCPYQKHFAPAHWVDSEIVVGHITPEEIEVAERLSPEIDMPMKSAGTSDLLYTTIPFFVWDKINSLVGAGVQAFPDYSGLNYTVQYYGNQKNHLENLVDVAEGETDIMFGSERYHATVLASEDGGYYIKTDSLRPYGADFVGSDDEIFYQLEAKINMDDGWEHIGDFTNKEEAIKSYQEHKNKHPEVRLLEVLGYSELEYDDETNDFRNAEEDKGRYGHMFDYPIVYANDSSDRRGYLIGYADGAIWNTGIMYGGIERNRDFINDVGQQRLKRMNYQRNRYTDLVHGHEDKSKDILKRNLNEEKSSTDDPDFDPEKADRNKDGEISDWERAVGNAVAKGIRESRERKGAESYQVGDEGMFEGGEIRILNIEDNSSQGKQNVYFYTYLDNEGNSDGFIHTTNERKLMNQFSMFPREWNAETSEYEDEVIETCEECGTIDSLYDYSEGKICKFCLNEENTMGAETFEADTRKYLGVWVNKQGDKHYYLYSDDDDYVFGELRYEPNWKAKGWEHPYWDLDIRGGKSLFVKSFNEGVKAFRQEMMNAEEFNVEFDDWADQEMLTHGETVSFKEWAKEEGKKHGDMDLTDWAEEEEESHDERYGAESIYPDTYREEYRIMVAEREGDELVLFPNEYYETLQDAMNDFELYTQMKKHQVKMIVDVDGGGQVVAYHSVDGRVVGKPYPQYYEWLDKGLDEESTNNYDYEIVRAEEGDWEVIAYRQNEKEARDLRNEGMRAKVGRRMLRFDYKIEKHPDKEGWNVLARPRTQRAETFESPATQDKIKPRTIATLLGAGALAALLAPEHLKKFFNR